MLDNTLIYWMSEIGDGHDHTRLSEIEYPQVPSSLPLLTIGGCGGALKNGQVVRAPLGSPPDGAPPLASAVNRPATDLYLTLAKALGASNATFPGTTGTVPGVLL